jgi:hypothetical protein
MPATHTRRPDRHPPSPRQHCFPALPESELLLHGLDSGRAASSSDIRIPRRRRGPAVDVMTQASQVIPHARFYRSGAGVTSFAKALCRMNCCRGRLASRWTSQRDECGYSAAATFREVDSYTPAIHLDV